MTTRKQDGMVMREGNDIWEIGMRMRTGRNGGREGCRSEARRYWHT